MSDAQARLFDTIPTAHEQAADDREHELDRTPRGVVRQALARLLGSTIAAACESATVKDVTVDGRRIWDGHKRERDDPLRVLDWCAGSGVWASEVRAWAVAHGIPVHITGVELRESERENLDRWCDEVIIGDWRDALLPRNPPYALHDGPDILWLLDPPSITAPHFDLAVGNPAFSLMLAGLPLLLEHATAAIVLHTTETLQRTEAGAALAASHPPTRELGIPGSVRYRGQGTGADQRIYSVSAWVAPKDGAGFAHAGRGDWPREILPLLPSADRGWVEPPGGERVVLPCWPTRPGWVQP
jgi:hypothetical protein